MGKFEEEKLKIIGKGILLEFQKRHVASLEAFRVKLSVDIAFRFL